MGSFAFTTVSYSLCLSDGMQLGSKRVSPDQTKSLAVSSKVAGLLFWTTVVDNIKRLLSNLNFTNY